MAITQLITYEDNMTVASEYFAAVAHHPINGDCSSWIEELRECDEMLMREHVEAAQ